MRNTVTLSVLVLISAGLVGCATAPDMGGTSLPANPIPERLSQAQMPAYCRGEASAEFGQRPQDISTLPAERDKGMFTVYGQFPPDTQNATFFTCTFSADGEFVGVDRN